MERLTTKSVLGGWTLKVPRQEAVDRLAAYEDTRLEPEEIKRLRKNEEEEAAIDIEQNILPIVGGKSLQLAVSALHRISEYDRVGLELDICAEYKKFEDELVASGKSFQHILDLLAAEQDGRLVVLPVRPYTEVWAGRNKEGLHRCVYSSPVAILDDVERGYVIRLTRAEAEAALRGEER